jgi:hypothetical protein
METVALVRFTVLRTRPEETLFTFKTSVIWVSAAATVRLRVCIDAKPVRCCRVEMDEGQGGVEATGRKGREKT